jgi:shikimate dehydrogenase
VISGHTAVYAVIGHPVSHSLSPAMHNAAFAHLGMDAVYVALPVEPSGLPDALRGAHALGIRGLNVTVPHKQGAAAACAVLDGVAAEVGAANTLRRLADGWEGFNTDAPACLALLEAAGLGRGARALLLGAGGAARAAGWALARAGAEVRIAARRSGAAAALADHLRSAVAGARADAVGWEEAGAESGRADAVVNGTSVGLAGQEGRLPPLRLRRGQVVLDFVYGETELAGAARAAGARLVTGEQVLVRQGALAFTLWTGRPAPEAVMAAAIGAGAGSSR